MAYTSEDRQALENARLAGIVTKGVETVDSSHCLQTLLCPRSPKTAHPASVLAKAIEASDRFMAGTTVCLEVEGTPVPDYVRESIDLLKSYPVKIVIVCGGASTHKPGPLLDDELCQAVSIASPGGMLWHPIANQLV